MNNIHLDQQVKVSIRVRQLSKNEINKGEKCIVKVLEKDNTVQIDKAGKTRRCS